MGNPVFTSSRSTATGTIYPGAPEVPFDGVDQDCNGFDLTVVITKAEYRAKKDELIVEATSSLGSQAALLLAGYGPMQWAKGNQWRLTVPAAGGDPGTVTVTGREGSVSQAVLRK